MTTSSTPEVAEYTAGSVRILKDVNHIRVRPGMYIGDTGSRGLHNMTFEVIDLALEETREGGGNRIEVTLLRDGGCRVLDNGAGIPVQIDDELQRPYVEAAMTCWLSSRFEKGRYRCHSGPPMHNFGWNAANALSRRLVVEVQRDDCLGRRSQRRPAIGSAGMRSAERDHRHQHHLLARRRDIQGESRFLLSHLQRKVPRSGLADPGAEPGSATSAWTGAGGNVLLG